MPIAADLQNVFARAHRLAEGHALDGLTLTSVGECPALAVDGKVFAHQHDTAMIALHCPTEQKALLLEISPEIYAEMDGPIGQPTILVRLETITDEELSLRLADAWGFVRESATPQR